MSDSLRPPRTAACQAPLSFMISKSLLKLMPIELVMHPTISSSVASFSCLQSFPASRSFQMSQFFTSGSQSIGVSASTSVLPMNTQDWSPLGWTGWISLQFRGLSRVFSNTTVESINSSALRLLYDPTRTSMHEYWENRSFDDMDLCRQSDVSAFQYVVSACHRSSSKEQMSFSFMTAVTIHSDFGAQENKYATVSMFPSSICHEVSDGAGGHVLSFSNVEF